MTLATSANVAASVLKSHSSAAAASSASAAAGGPAAGAADVFAALLQGLCGDSAAAGATTLSADPGAATEGDAAAAPGADIGAGALTADPLLAALADVAQAQTPTPAAAPQVPAAPAADAAQNLPGLAALLQAAQAHEQRPGRRAASEGSGAPGGAGATTQDPARPVAGKAMAAVAVPGAVIDPAAPAPATPVPAAGAFAAALAQQGTAERAETREPATHAAGLGTELAPAALPPHDLSAQLATPAAPAGTVHQAALPTHPLDAAFGGDLAAEVKVMVEGGVQQAELHLNPADLGPIRIQLSLNAQTADISLAAAHSLTREGLAQALPALREMLADQGLSLGQAAVSGGGGGDASAFQPPQREAKAPRGEASHAGGTGGPTGLAPAATTLQLRPGRGMLDLYA